MMIGLGGHGKCNDVMIPHADRLEMTSMPAVHCLRPTTPLIIQLAQHKKGEASFSQPILPRVDGLIDGANLSVRMYVALPVDP